MQLAANFTEPKKNTAPPRVGANLDDVSLWFDQHATFLLRVAQRLTGSGSHIEDLVQETFLVAHRKRHVLHTEQDIRAWLYRVLINLIQHHRRSLARRIRLSNKLNEQLVPQTPIDPQQSAEQHELSCNVRACIDSLDLKQREVFVLYELESSSAQEIASLLGISENTVWSRLRSARKSFLKAWDRAEKVRRTL